MARLRRILLALVAVAVTATVLVVGRPRGGNDGAGGTGGTGGAAAAVPWAKASAVAHVGRDHGGVQPADETAAADQPAAAATHEWTPPYHDTAIDACLDPALATDDARRACVEAVNAASPIYNVDRFPLPTGGAPIPGVVIVIPIYNRHEHLRFVLEALARNAHINETTILVSMDAVHDGVYSVIREFRAARIKAVYHAYSATFLKDVLWAQFLHRYQRTRHHYNWLWHYLYRTARDPEFLPPGGDVFFLEDDLFPLDDLYPAVRALHRLLPQVCPPTVCFCVNVGLPESRTPTQPRESWGLYSVNYSRYSSWGWGVNRASMEPLFQNAKFYCDYNDYNHDWSLAHMAQQGHIGGACLNTYEARVRHFGLCGNHFHGTDCSAAHAVDALNSTVIAPHMAAIGSAEAAARAWDEVAQAPERVPSPADDGAFLELPRARDRPPFWGNEGWTFGRIFDRDFRPGDPLYHDRARRPTTWTLSGHRDHCYHLLGVQ